MNAAPRSQPAPAVPAPGLSVMWKTVADDCNLACDYCYYSSSGRPAPGRHRIDRALLENTIREYMARSRGAVCFAWQGGEPLLAGLQFFEEAVALQARHAPAGTTISNVLQTNGTLLNEDWARFFRRYNFLVGVSIDGPPEIHDAHRVTATGKGSFALVMRKIGHLRQHGVDFNILTVLHQDNVGRPRELMEFYAHADFRYVQFIPGMDFRSDEPGMPARYLITPAQYGKFLRATFDVWYNDGNPVMSVRIFDNMLGLYAGRQAELCTHCRSCPATLVLEHNGDAYPCDFYMSAEWRLGNIGTARLDTLLTHPSYTRFRNLKVQLPERCRRCDWLKFCYGGCPRNREWDPTGKAIGADYFCASYRELFTHAHEKLSSLALSLRAQWLLNHVRSGHDWPGRNEPCVCGSGRKFKQCCAPLGEELGITATRRPSSSGH